VEKRVNLLHAAIFIIIAPEGFQITSEIHFHCVITAVKTEMENTPKYERPKPSMSSLRMFAAVGGLK
jgi:hypothetical protein